MSGVLLTPVLKNLATGEGACGRAGPPFMVAISLSQTKPRVLRFFEHFAKGGNGNVSTTERARNRSRVSLPALEKAKDGAPEIQVVEWRSRAQKAGPPSMASHFPPDSFHQFSKSRIAAHFVEDGFRVEFDQVRIAPVVCPFQPFKCLLFVGRGSIDLCDVVRQNVPRATYL